jgi:hypothetical protein
MSNRSSCTRAFFSSLCSLSAPFLALSLLSGHSASYKCQLTLMTHDIRTPWFRFFPKFLPYAPLLFLNPTLLLVTVTQIRSSHRNSSRIQGIEAACCCRTHMRNSLALASFHASSARGPACMSNASFELKGQILPNLDLQV